MNRIRVGLLGAGRLGRVYARDLAGAIPEARLAALGDIDEKTARETARRFDVPFYTDPLHLLSDETIEAVVIVTPTNTHATLVKAAAEAGKAVFCEKPLSISLAESVAMKESVERAGVFFQMGFMRRFDPGYAQARKKIDEGAIGKPTVFKSSSRDPFRPSLEYLDPGNSGGMIVDMGIHDFDLALWLMGPVEKVSSAGGTLVYPELNEIGDIDNAIVTLSFQNGGLGVVDLSRKGVYGYDISTEILGSEGALRVGYLRETPLLVLAKGQVSHDTVPYFPERFASAYTLQLRDFAQNVVHGRPPSITIEAGIEALRVAIAATRSLHSGEPVAVASVRE